MLLADIVVIAVAIMSRIRQVYACALVFMIVIEAVTPSSSRDESYAESATDWVLENPGTAAIGATLGAGAAVVAAPYVVGALGFTAAGIAAKSTAAWAMSLFGAWTPAAPGIVATMQSIGATGSLVGSGATAAATGSVGAMAGVAATKAATDRDRNRRD